MITEAELDAAPIGSKVIFDYERGSSGKAVYRKTAEGWSCVNINGEHHGTPARAAAIALNWREHPGRTRIVPPQSAPIRVWSWTATFGRAFYSWRCNSCEDFDVCFTDSQEAHTAARAHAKGHAAEDQYADDCADGGL